MSNRPIDFDAYWSDVDRELGRYPGAPGLEPMPRHSTEFASVYALRITSIGPYRIFGYLSVPAGDGRVPGLIETPNYGSVNHVPAYELRQRYVVLTIMHRGQRLADQPFAAAYPGLLTLGIDDPASYAYRGIVADCLRSAEFLLSHPRVDADRVGIVGDDLALITAARRPHFAAVRASGLRFYRMLDACAQTDAYPLEEVNDYLRSYPERREAIERTLAYFDPIQHVHNVTARTLLATEDSGSINGPEWLQPLAAVLGDRAELHQLTHEGRTDHTWLDRWMATHLSANEPATVA